MDSEDFADTNEPEMRPHPSFKGGQWGRYAHLFPPETDDAQPRFVALSPDMAAVFPDSDSVNEALRTLVKAVHALPPDAPASVP